MKHFSFLLFENFHLATNHHIDMVLIAKLLQHQGLNVGILNLYGENECENIEGIPVVNLSFSDSIPNDEWCIKPKNKIHSMFALCRFLWQQHRFMKRVVKEIEPMADYFYCGSYHVRMSSQTCLINKPCYYWGLRTERMRDIKTCFLKNFIDGIHMWWLKRRFMKNPYQRLFVSNPLIMEEHEIIGLCRNRMVIREERCINKRGENNFQELPDVTTFLVIGKLRKQKHVPFTIKTYQMANIKNSQLLLVGQSDYKYEKEIIDTIGTDDKIKRINTFLTYEDFNKKILQSHFVVFADEQGLSCITNGTMMEALINYRPIICPNYNPYTYYIEKYHVGILYTPHDISSYAEAMQRATKLGVEYFASFIDEFLKTVLFDRVSSDLYNGIKENDKAVGYNQ